MIKSAWEMWSTPPEDVSCIIEPGLLPSEGIMVILGEPGVGKTFLALQMAFEITEGRRLLGLFPTKAKRTAYFELEKRSPIARSRIANSRWRDEYIDSASNFGYYDEATIRLDDNNGVRQLKEMLLSFGAEVAVIDSYSSTLNDEAELKNQKKTILNYRNIGNELRVSFILIQHLIKRPAVYVTQIDDYKEPPLRLDDMRGSKYMEYEVDTVVGLTHSKIGRTRKLGFLKHSHCPLPLTEEDPIELTFDGRSPRPFIPRSHADDIIKVLKKNDMVTFHYIESKLGISRPTLLKAKDDLVRLGIIDVTEHGGRESSMQIKL